MNYRMNISYDGTKYKGWQRQKDAKSTIQGKIEQTLSKYFEEDIKIIGASRTDAGVHAKMQVANFVLKSKIDTEKARMDINSYLPSDIVVNDILFADDRFHSRFNAKKKEYEYTIWKADAKYPPLFNRKYVYHIDRMVNIKKMREAAEMFLGEHDFKGFSSDKTKKGTIRNIERIDISEDEFMIKINIVGDGFLYNMIRIIVGTMIEIGAGEKTIKIIDDVFKTKNRELAGYTVPACGLFLGKIIY
ncbi:MAG: tRNA pseudouridine(38-40) synthase TruA [Eubacteriales bacterium]